MCNTCARIVETIAGWRVREHPPAGSTNNAERRERRMRGMRLARRTVERRDMNAEIHRRADAANPSVVLLPPDILRPTEEILASRFREVSERLFAAGVWQEPILVEQASLVVMDGHHRRAFALANGFARVPCVLLSYAEVSVESRREDQCVTPHEVIARGLEGRLYPAKSTRHIIPGSARISCHFPLERLRYS
ncbi:ParB N-terminal domain-containing protein [Burkholderia gladioli]|uniref:ParB N-terminal domain-containing protein n=2 Tax=Burkholderia gladioli TaxID=28095 RepID=UPI000F53A8E6|nr:ParB N-terminal domain-containing protein [Burkholderia gladioli]MBJ9661323.1 ParB N-terminal domain-containing protein [Burkholderia gladioli]MBJ9712891.1 ParB N-terminal domain-containing protein [Burkholderia gladioli]MBU9156675.1 ParB N-terminal domain-containing protein [Burkholderia gladioli]MCH7272942.1 ParB N-terminal domain-containing protein [Burkholderia gladioli]MDN7806520.1 ParB N-terminal domain-containing protein [Burkholderia gladioli]